MSREDFANLMKEIKEETAAYGPAAADAKKDGDANKGQQAPLPRQPGQAALG
jgi:hypothetical protein